MSVGEEIDQLVRVEVSGAAQDVYLMPRAMQESLEQSMAYGLVTARDVYKPLPAAGSFVDRIFMVDKCALVKKLHNFRCMALRRDW